MQCSSTFMRISGPIPEVEKNFIGKWLGKWYWILRRIPAKRGVGKQVWFDPAAVGESGGGTTPRKNYPLLSLETAFLALELAQNCYVNMSISFSWKLPI